MGDRKKGKVKETVMLDAIPTSGGRVQTPQ